MSGSSKHQQAEVTSPVLPLHQFIRIFKILRSHLLSLVQPLSWRANKKGLGYKGREWK